MVGSLLCPCDKQHGVLVELSPNTEFEHVEAHSETRYRSWIGLFMPGWTSCVWSECWAEGRNHLSKSSHLAVAHAFREQFSHSLLTTAVHANRDIYLKKPPRLLSWLQVKGQALVPCSDFSWNKKIRWTNFSNMCWFSATILYFIPIMEKTSFNYIG